MVFEKSACIEPMYWELPFLDRFQAAKRDGFSHVEFWSWMDKDLRAVRRAAEEAGIGIAGFNGDAELSLINPAQKKDYLDSSRPTAVNLSWALKRMDGVARASHEAGRSVPEILEDLKAEAEAIRDEDIAVCRKIGEYGLSLIGDGDGILTHCNAGKLAAVRYGTATAPIYLGQEKGYHLRVFCDETRPLLQGARLTAFELSASGIDTTLICDNMSGMVMKNGWVDAVFVGCDRVAANGDTANKIGTSMAALAARQYGVPFYVCAPTSTIDMETLTGDDIVIEERNPGEVTEMWYEKPMAPKRIKVYNPAFDVTDHSLITGIVTEYGVARPPYRESLREIFSRKDSTGRK